MRCASLRGCAQKRGGSYRRGTSKNRGGRKIERSASVSFRECHERQQLLSLPCFEFERATSIDRSIDRIPMQHRKKNFRKRSLDGEDGEAGGENKPEGSRSDDEEERRCDHVRPNERASERAKFPGFRLLLFYGASCGVGGE